MATQQKKPYSTIKHVGMGGVSTLDDPQNIEDDELAYARNVNFEHGVIGPREGSLFLLDKPSGETGVPTQILPVNTSDGTDFFIAVYGKNFYFYDSVTPQWIKINGSVTPTIEGPGVWYGSSNWNSGKNNDTFYFCNGTDQFVKWQTSIGYLTSPALAGDTVLSLDATRFPPAGGYSVIIQNGATQIIKAVTSANATSITLSSNVGSALSAGTAITIQCVNVASMSIGNIITKYYRRLFVSGGENTESSIFFSKIDLPEDFGTTATLTTGGSAVITQGEGGITDLQGFGTYLLVCKKDTMLNFSFQIDSNLSSQIFQIQPLIYGYSMGPFKPYLNMTIENKYYFPTETNGIFEVDPTSTGTTTSVETKSISEKAIDIVLNTNFTFVPGRATSHARKAYWVGSNLADGVPKSGLKNLTNNLVVMYDLRWDAWTVYDNWNVADLQHIDGGLYFISKDTGGLYIAYQGLFEDVASGPNAGAYTCIATTKRHDFGLPAQVKQFENPLYIQGYIEPGTTLYVDVLYNEMGSLGKQTFKIDGNNSSLVSLAPIVSLSDSTLGTNTLGGTLTANVTPMGNLFRCYLDVSKSYSFYDVQLSFYSTDIGSNWGISFYGFDQELNEKVPPELVISPSK